MTSKWSDVKASKIPDEAAAAAVEQDARELRGPLSAREQLHHRINNDFIYHAPHGDQALRYEAIRDDARVMAHELVNQCPPSRELSLALTHLEETVFWANAAIARNEPEPT